MKTQAWNRVLVLSVLVSLPLTASAWGYGVQQIVRHQFAGFDGLDEVSSVTVSDDGRHIYAAGLGGLVVAWRNPDSGRLTALQSLDAEIEYQVYGIRSLALSPDGRHLYGAGSLSSGVAVFTRDVNSGLLTWVQTLEDSDTLADLDGAWDILVEPQGDFVYVLASRGNKINTFSRDAATGLLEFVSSERVNAMSPLSLPTGMDMTPDARHIYVVGNGSIGIFDRDGASGETEFASLVPFGDLAPLNLALDLAFDADGTTAYIVGRVSPFPQSAVVRMSRDVTSGALTFEDALVDEAGEWLLNQTSQLIVAADGTSLYATEGRPSSGNSRLVVFRRHGDGSLEVAQVLIQAEEGVDGLIRLMEPVTSPDGEYLYVPAPVGETLGIWRRQADGTLIVVDVVENGRDVVLDGLDDPYYLVAPPDGSDVYVMGWGNESLAQWEREPDGLLILDQTIDLRALAGPDAGEIRLLAASPNGRFVLARADFGVVLLFERTGAGELIFLAAQDLGMSIAETVFTADNRFLLISDGEDDLRVFEIAAGTGQLTLRHHVQQFGDSFDSLAIDPLGRHLYAGGSFGSEVQVLRYALDANTAEPVFVESVDVAGGIGRRFWELALSADGRHLIAVSSGSTNTGEPGVVVFSRDPVTGALTEIQRLQDGVDGLDQFRRPRELAISPDGSRVALNTDGALSFFERDIASGQLSLLEQKIVGAPGEPPDLVGRGALAFGPEGEQLYMPSLIQNSLTVWDADASPCIASDTALCLGVGDRFRVEVAWRDFVGETGVGTRVTESVDSGLFWFFDVANWEMLVKVVDGCQFNGHFWVFSAATTNVAYTLTVTDTETGETATYENPLGTSAAAVTDTEALATCP